MASAASRCRYRSRPSKAVQRPSGPWTRLAITRWGVQQRTAFSGRPVVEPHGQDPLPGHVLDTAVAAAGPQVLVQIADRLGQPSVMGLEHRPAGRRVPQAVEDRDALGLRSTTSKAGTARLPWGRPAARRCRGCGPRTWPGTRPPMLRPAALGRGRQRRTTGLGTRRGQTGTARGRWPAPGCSTPPALPRAWRCRPPPAAPSPPSLARANAPLVHCSPRTITGRA